MSQLWAIYISGPDEYHAAPNEESAKHMADLHIAAMQEYITKNNLNWAAEIITAEVVEWPYDAKEHAAELEEFDYAGWGLEGQKP